MNRPMFNLLPKTIVIPGWFRVVKALLFLLLILFLVQSFSQKINLVTADLGRHIINGQELLQKGHLLKINFYSYTQPDFPVLTTHWGCGPIFYWTWKAFGFEGLSVFYTILILLSVGVVFFLVKQTAGFSLAYWAVVLSIPLLASRLEIRPEGFSHLFFVVFLYVLWQYRAGKLSFRWLWILPFLQVLWVNLHILFPLGLFLIGLFLADSWLTDRHSRDVRRYLTVLGVSTLACLVNPWGFRGAIAPFLVLSEYGYRLAEMQSVRFMQKRTGDFNYLHLEMLLAISFISSAWVFIRKQFSRFRIEVVVLFTTAAIAWSMIRSLPIFGLAMIFVLPLFLWQILREEPRLTQTIFKFIALVMALMMVGIGLTLNHHYYELLPKPVRGAGLAPGVNHSMAFFKAQGIQGPIFNNYDIGGYLIFHLHPSYRFFVDNRPEAYSVDFFKKLYAPMQEDEAVWTSADQRYGFNVIYFFRHDQTTWAQPFLIRRIRDPQWAPVFVDGYAIILLKRNRENADIIRQYELPQAMFNVVAP